MCKTYIIVGNIFANEQYHQKLMFSEEISQGCKLLSDIGQCPTKFGKCPSKRNFDRKLVRSQKKLSHTFFFVASEWLYTNLSRDLYISCDVYMSDQLSDVGFCPTKFKLCPTKIKSDRTNVLSSQIFICSPVSCISVTLFKTTVQLSCHQM